MAAPDGDEDWDLTLEDLQALGLVGQEEVQDAVFPDIHELFRYYNVVYFQGKLEFCSVEWSTGRMTLCAGICMFSKHGGCRIKLSEPLLKYRPVKDLKETLLHEMIHAYQFLVDKASAGGVRDDHGPRFQSLMRAINTSTVPDIHRPPGGYAVDTHHTMIDEVNLYRKHWWQCNRCGNIVKRAMNRRPQPADCRGRQGRGDACRDPLCLYHMHIKTCGGEYVKIKGPDLDATGPEAQPGTAKSRKRAAPTGSDGHKATGPQATSNSKRPSGGGTGAGTGFTPPLTRWFTKAESAPGASSSASVPLRPVDAGPPPTAALPTTSGDPDKVTQRRRQCLEAAEARTRQAAQGAPQSVTTAPPASSAGVQAPDVITLDNDTDQDEGGGEEHDPGPSGSGGGGGGGDRRPLPSQYCCPVCCQTWAVGSITNQDLNRHIDQCLGMAG